MWLWLYSSIYACSILILIHSARTQDAPSIDQADLLIKNYRKPPQDYEQTVQPVENLATVVQPEVDEVAAERERHQMRHNILTGRNEMFMQVWQAPCCGRFVRTLIPFANGDLVAEYVGDILLSEQEVDAASAAHNHTNHMGYIFKYDWNGVIRWRDPDSEVLYGNRMARLFSHGINSINMVSRVIGDDNDIPHIILVASKDIAVGDELKYNYGVPQDEQKKKTHG